MFLGFRNKAYLNLIKFDLGSPKHRNSQNVIKTIFLCYLSVFKDHDNTVKVSSHYFCLVSRTDFYGRHVGAQKKDTNMANAN